MGVFKFATEAREAPAGTVIFEAGSAGEEMFGVVRGKVELRLPDAQTFEIGPDETFGEMAIVDASPRRRGSPGRHHAGGYRQAAVPLPRR